MTADDHSEAVVAHYSPVDLLGRVALALREAGLADRLLAPDDLGPVDEFHIGGAPATMSLAEHLDLEPSSHVVDLGSGLGGPARRVAVAYGCRVTGIDLTPAYVEVAEALTHRSGLGDRVQFCTGSVLDLPFEDHSFDAAMQLHVGMNLPDKARSFAEMARVVRPGGVVGIYDVVWRDGGRLEFPVPWASTPGQSHVGTVEEYVEGLEGAGFDVEMRDQSARAVATLRAMAERAGTPGPLGLHLVLGSTAAVKLKNLGRAVSDGVLGPVEVIARRPPADPDAAQARP